MLEFFIFLFFFFISLVSILGYGKIFQKSLLNKIDHDQDLNLYLGFYGLAFLTLISLFTSFFKTRLLS